MPIKPENRARYPADWPAIRAAILQRARYCCEWPGCTARHGTLGYWRPLPTRHEWVPLPRALKDAGVDKPTEFVCAEGSVVKIILLVLTIAHLDHVPEHCAPENLRAWCQRHHLAYDAKHHAATAYATRKANARTLDLFADGELRQQQGLHRLLADGHDQVERHV